MCDKCILIEGNMEIARELGRGLTDLGTIALIKADIAAYETLLTRARALHPMPVTN